MEQLTANNGATSSRRSRRLSTPPLAENAEPARILPDLLGLRCFINQKFPGFRGGGGRGGEFSLGLWKSAELSENSHRQATRPRQVSESGNFG